MEDTIEVIRELMLAVEFLRAACEHSEGRLKLDRARLKRATSVGIRTNARFKHLCPDYQRPTFWQDVFDLG